MAAVIYLFLCFLAVPCILASNFQPCYKNVDYPVKIQRVNVIHDRMTDERQDVSIRYTAYSDRYIRNNRVKVDTFISTENSQEIPNTETHPLCRDTECPIIRGDKFTAEFRPAIPYNAYGTLSLLMRLVDKFTGRELTCIVVNFDNYDYDRIATKNEQIILQ